MTGTAVKRKRFEGLIQFQEPLRQALVCIQASGAARFATAIQSEFLQARNTPDLSHFLLTSDGSAIGDLTKGIEAKHLLMAVEQLEEGEVSWKHKTPRPDVKISAWVNSGDPLVCQQLYCLLAAAGNNQSTFDLNELSPTGTLKNSFKDSMNKVWVKGERQDLFEDFMRDAGKIFQAEKTVVASDGCTVSLLVEGFTNLKAAEAHVLAIKHLKKATRHLVIVNYIGGPRPRLQCVYLTPMRLPLKELQSSAHKGFVLLRDIKETAQLAKSVLAS